jgi:hypothetical protein
MKAFFSWPFSFSESGSFAGYRSTITAEIPGDVSAASHSSAFVGTA